MFAGIFPCCATEGTGLNDGMDWLTNTLQERKVKDQNHNELKDHEQNGIVNSDGNKIFTKGWKIMKMLFTQ
jgi:hypothetical protein